MLFLQLLWLENQSICSVSSQFGIEKCSDKHLSYRKIAHSIPKKPRRVTACGFQTGLSVLARTHSSDYFGTFLSTYGFRFMLGNSYDFQDENAETKFLNTDLEALINISPESTYSTSAIRRLPTHERNCLFSDEHQLNVMQKYTYTNCMAECRSTLIYNLCGCIPHSLPNNGCIEIHWNARKYYIDAFF